MSSIACNALNCSHSGYDGTDLGQGRNCPGVPVITFHTMRCSRAISSVDVELCPTFRRLSPSPSTGGDVTVFTFRIYELRLLFQTTFISRSLTIRCGPLKIRVCVRAKDCLNLALKAELHILSTCVHSYSPVHMQASVVTEARKVISQIDSEGFG
jgi:hypothetical protein